MHNVKRVSEEHKIDLYLRPPNISSFKLMDYHLMDRIVKDAYRWGGAQHQLIQVHGLPPHGPHREGCIQVGWGGTTTS